MENKINCRSELKQNIGKEIFDKETELCKRLSQKKGGCCWGSCDSCGVIPFLYKLYKGEVVDQPDEIRELKDKFLK